MNELPPETDGLLTSIIERFQRAAGKQTAVGIKPAELVDAVSLLARNQDTKGLENLFVSYLDWELSGSSQRGESDAFASQRAMENFDFIAQLADNVASTGDKMMAEFLAVSGDQRVGRVRAFYRQTVGYELFSG